MKITYSHPPLANKLNSSTTVLITFTVTSHSTYAKLQWVHSHTLQSPLQLFELNPRRLEKYVHIPTPTELGGHHIYLAEVNPFYNIIQ
mmetsp:Transcript_28674/g.40900  ORF Transcript_28674/g.40900 Transcript_28674/m.40900 type:complete len:88 (+) Transcript_28674:175-438(+)